MTRDTTFWHSDKHLGADYVFMELMGFLDYTDPDETFTIEEVRDLARDAHQGAYQKIREREKANGTPKG